MRGMSTLDPKTLYLYLVTDEATRCRHGLLPTVKEAEELLNFVLDQGINLIDTARAYTVSEEYLGFALDGIRDRFVLATKSMARTKEGMEQDIAISMKKLRTDYIDLYGCAGRGSAIVVMRACQCVWKTLLGCTVVSFFIFLCKNA